MSLQALNPFRKLDRRIAAELAAQRRAITIGLLCVIVASLLDGLLLPVMKRSLDAMGDAMPRTQAAADSFNQRRDAFVEQADQVAKKLNLDKTATEDTFKRDFAELDQRNADATADRLAADLHRQPGEVKGVLLNTSGQAGGDLGAVNRLGIFSLAVVAIFAVKYWFTRGQNYYLGVAAARLSSDLRERLFAKLQRLPVSYFGEKRVGAIQSVLTNDVNVYQNAVGAVRDSIQGPIVVVVSFGYVLFIQAQLALVVALFLPAMAYVINRNGRKIKSSQAAVQDSLAEVSATTTESLQGLRVIKAFAFERESQQRYEALVERSYESQIVASRRFAALRPLVELIGATAIATVLYICGWLAYRGETSVGAIGSLLFAMDRLNQGIRSLTSVTATFNQVQAASERIHSEVLEIPDQVQMEGARTLASVVGKIDFEHVTFRYPDGTEALHDVSFSLEPGTSLALVGPSGAGKSTIADLILRFYDPSEGRITLDGVDLREFDLHWLRKQIGVVPQNTFLFAGSVAENIRMGKPDATDGEVVEAACAANANEFIDKLEAGYGSNVGEGGSRVSGGQRQRIAIARALVRKPALLLLDEATSALDATSERAVTEALDDIMRQRTSLFIAHRLTTAARADRILVLAKGRVVEEGSHAELMEHNGQYAALFRIFSGGLLEGDLGG